MELPQYPAITAFCRIISDLPDDTRRTALGFVCNALGQAAEPTGIEFSPDRPIRHLYWDFELKDLFKRLVYLVEKVGLKEQLAVQGAASYIVTHFELWADPEFSQSSTQSFRHTIEGLEDELKAPVSKRKDGQSDEEIRDFISHLNELISTAEMRRKNAEEAVEFLNTQCQRTFTLKVWDALNHFAVHKSRRKIDDLLGSDGEDDSSGSEQ